jgi:hypothetical protein
MPSPGRITNGEACGWSLGEPVRDLYCCRPHNASLTIACPSAAVEDGGKPPIFRWNLFPPPTRPPTMRQPYVLPSVRSSAMSDASSSATEAARKSPKKTPPPMPQPGASSSSGGGGRHGWAARQAISGLFNVAFRRRTKSSPLAAVRRETAGPLRRLPYAQPACGRRRVGTHRPTGRPL